MVGFIPLKDVILVRVQVSQHFDLSKIDQGPTAISI